MDRDDDLIDPDSTAEIVRKSAAELDAWHEGGRTGARPPGRLRRLEVPDLGPVTRVAALPPYLLLHDPDGRPPRMRLKNEY